MSFPQLDHPVSAPLPRTITTSGQWIEDTGPDSYRAPPTAAAPDLRPAAALLDAASRMHNSNSPHTVLHIIAIEALSLLTADGVVVLAYDRNGPTLVLDLPSTGTGTGTGTGTDADGVTPMTRCLRLREAHLLQPGHIADLDHHRPHHLQPLNGDDLLESTRWRSLLVADLDDLHVHRPTRLLWYARTPNAFTTNADLALLFARHAGLALQAAAQHHHLERAVDSRTTTGQATGILMHRYRLTAEQAFETLKRYSQERNMKLRDVAETIVHTGEAPT